MSQSNAPLARTFTESAFEMVRLFFADQSLIHPMAVLDLRFPKILSVRIKLNPTDAEIDAAIDDAIAANPTCQGYAIFYEARGLFEGVPAPTDARKLSDTMPLAGVEIATEGSPDIPERCVFVILVAKERRPQIWRIPVIAPYILGGEEDLSHVYEIKHVRPLRAGR